MTRATRDPIQPAPPSCADLLKTLGEATRLHIVGVLFAGPRRVYEIGDELEIEQSLLSHHLRSLRKAGIVESRRDGKSVVYSLAPGARVHGRGASQIDLGCCRVTFPPGPPPPSHES